MNVMKKSLKIMTAVFILMCAMIAVCPNAAAETTSNVELQQAQAQTQSNMKFLGAALAVGFSCIGGGIAISMTCSAAIGAITERPELFPRCLILAGLAEGVALYGVVVALLILYS